VTTCSTTGATRILVVEDESVVAKDLERALEDLGYQVAACAQTGSEAIRLAGELSPDLLLMDVRLKGGMDGIEAAAAIKQRQQIPVVYLTAFSDVGTMERAVVTEPLGYLVKPIQEAELRCAIEVAMNRHRLEVSLRDREETFRRASLFDDLTGIYNRRGFFAFAEQELKTVGRYHETPTLFFIDVDNLKTINDEFGHEQGDRALRDLATMLTRTFRASDIIGRLGGDEFAVLMARGKDTSAAVDVIRRLRENVAAFSGERPRPPALEISIGAATFDATQREDIETLLARADSAMYADKERRRTARGSPRG
jgi:two-component system, cell cycle response regulator